MKSILVKKIAVFLMLIAGASNFAVAASNKLDMENLINIAGRQRMLSQEIAKDYLYIGKHIEEEKAKKELVNSIKKMEDNHKLLVDSVNDPEIKNLLAFVQMSVDDFKSIITKKFNIDNAQIALDLSESILEGSQYVVDSLKKKSGIKKSEIVAKSGRQRMLAQRIAKYYIAYQVGIKDKNTIDQMNDAIKNFSDTNKFLMANPTNTPGINRELNKVNRLWKIVYKFYLNIAKGGLPLIVFSTTNTITKDMDNVTNLYIKLSANKE